MRVYNLNWAYKEALKKKLVLLLLETLGLLLEQNRRLQEELKIKNKMIDRLLEKDYRRIEDYEMDEHI